MKKNLCDLITKASITDHHPLHFKGKKKSGCCPKNMENQAVRRRIKTISAHFAAGILTEDVTAPNSHFFPLNCSSNSITSFTRLYNRMQYGRQASSSQGPFMRPAIDCTEQGNLDARPEHCSAKCVREAKPTTLDPPMYARPGSEEPLFSRPIQDEYNCPNIDIPKSLIKQDKILPSSECRASAKLQEEDVTCARPAFSSQINGRGWSPRINVIEPKTNHFITVELPGVEINDIKVEIDDKRLTVRGNRSVKWWKTAGCPKDSLVTYHRREITQGPYQVIWPLPPGVDKNSVSAELVEGILHIRIPKL